LDDGKATYNRLRSIVSKHDVRNLILNVAMMQLICSFEERSSALQKYRSKKQTAVTAVRLELETEGFVYQKWGGSQRCKRGDWLVNNQGDVYTVDGETFDRTYRMVSPGVYEKTAPVWAEKTNEAGSIQTQEGATAYEAGDYLVFNDSAGKDGYAMKGDIFHSLYEPLENFG